jgi:hypothetical protein
MVLLIFNALQNGYITCVYCLDVTHTPQIDHVRSRKHGCNPKDLSNCVVACPTCNGAKQEKSVAFVFGQEVADRVNVWLDNRVLTDEMWETARTIYRLSYKTEKRIELIYNFVQKMEIEL